MAGYSVGSERLKLPAAALPAGSTPIAELAKVRIDCPDLCYRYTARVIRGIKIGPSPDWLARRLETLRGSGRWGCRLIDRLLPDSGGHSPLERRFLRLCRSAGLPRPRTQVVFRDRSGKSARIKEKI